MQGARRHDCCIGCEVLRRGCIDVLRIPCPALLSTALLCTVHTLSLHVQQG